MPLSRLPPFLVLALLSACDGGEKPADDTGDDTSGATDSEETAESGESAETGETGETGETAETGCEPTGDEVPYDGVDNDCDAATPDDDLDGDGYPHDQDCADEDPEVNPGAVEVCDGVDNDCAGGADGADAVNAPPWHPDRDGDHYGDPDEEQVSCTAPEGWVGDDSDCDDGHATVHPDAPELCDDLDNDCDGSTDEDIADLPTWHPDSDGDGYGSSTSSVSQCSAPDGYIADDSDCNDRSADVYPGAEEVCNRSDDDCDGEVNEGLVCEDTGGGSGGFGGHRVYHDGSYYYALYSDPGVGVLGTSEWYGRDDAASGPEGLTWNEDYSVLYYNDLRGNVFALTPPFGDASTLVGSFAEYQVGGGVILGDQYFVGDYYDGDIHVMDLGTGAVSDYASLGDAACLPYFGNSTMAIDTDGAVYAASSCGMVKYTEGTDAVMLNSYSNLTSAVAMDADNELYALDNSGNIVHFDKDTGATLGSVRIAYAPSTTWALAVDDSGNFLVNYWGAQRLYSGIDGSTLTEWSSSEWYPGSTGYYWYLTW